MSGLNEYRIGAKTVTRAEFAAELGVEDSDAAIKAHIEATQIFFAPTDRPEPAAFMFQEGFKSGRAESADEIERLRAALRAACDALHSEFCSSEVNHNEVCAAARSALEAKP